MIERQNYLDCKEHLAYRREVCRDAESTLGTRWLALRWMLRWADDVLLAAAPTIRPTWPTWLGEQARAEGVGLAATTAEGMTSMARTFFRWAILAYPQRYRQVTPLWLDSLRAPEMTESPKERTYYTLADVEALCAVGEESLRCRRAQAAAAMLFLSGMRSGAFVTLPIRCVDVPGRRVRQWASEGVKTKNKVTATTYLLPIPSLLAVAQGWDDLVRGRLPDGAMWYVNLSMPSGLKDVEATFVQSRGRAHTLRYDLDWLCGLAGVRYLRPHDLRHGHVVYGESRARTAAERKAVSQNVMHSHASTTDAVYSRLTGGDQARLIAGLREASPARLPREGGRTRDQILADVAADIALLSDMAG